MGRAVNVTPLTEAQRKLAAEYVGHARAIAADRRKGVPGSVAGIAGDDIFSDAALGLVRAARAYRYDGGANFKTFSTRFIHGQISDGLRRRNFISRAARRRGERNPQFLSFSSAARGDDDRPVTLPDHRPPASDAYDALDEAETLLALYPAGRDREIIRRRFIKGESIYRIADELGFTASNVSRICTTAINEIRSKVARTGE